MMNQEQLAILATELQDARYSALLGVQDYEAIAALLNVQPEVSNPTPRPTVPSRPTFEAFVQVPTPTEIAMMYQTAPALVAEYRDYQRAGDRATARKLWNALKRLDFGQATKDSIDALWDATMPDPDWTPTILGPSRATALELPRISPSDIQAVDNAVS